MTREGWDKKAEAHYWRRADGMLTSLCESRSRPDHSDFELREGALPHRFSRYCREYMRRCIRDDLPTREGSIPVRAAGQGPLLKRRPGLTGKSASERIRENMRALGYYVKERKAA